MTSQTQNTAPSPWQTFSGQWLQRIPMRKIKIPTVSVKTLYRSDKISNAQAEMIRWDILVISETRWKRQDTLTRNNKNLFHYSGDDTAVHYGVRMLLTAEVNQKLLTSQRMVNGD